ncbi:DUF6325 family protein [Phycicoccus sp. M110.8]|uniref:DUF6325 family protein n=1 Tax=Phycicoccus sp. M110.8 TaxID=3075433 RepID=UPI0028FD220C|nr:DUF6325 family protein [Phycicoccus sp. M110.8]MDU0314161.1 DUF6325 family protein [Phycicoccus sp. M110.8]
MSTVSTMDVVGPIDFVLLEFPQDRLTGEVSTALADLVESGTIRLYDLVVLSKDLEGSVHVVELAGAQGSEGHFSSFAGAASGLIGDDDVTQAAAAIEPGTVAALIVYENRWAEPFVAAVVDSGGDLVASQRISAADLMDALEALETSDDVETTEG